MRPLERSLEKLDDVRRKKLSEMIAGSGDGVPAVASSGVHTFFMSMIIKSLALSFLYVI